MTWSSPPGSSVFSLAQGATPSRNAPLGLAPHLLGAHLQRIGAAPHCAIPHASSVETQLALLSLPRLVLSPVVRARVILADALDDTSHGDGGFGSTGRQERPTVLHPVKLQDKMTAW